MHEDEPPPCTLCIKPPEFLHHSNVLAYEAWVLAHKSRGVGGELKSESVVALLEATGGTKQNLHDAIMVVEPIWQRLNVEPKKDGKP
jgi:hypothetical protein